MAFDLEALLAPVSDEDPAGPDLSYDPERQTIKQAFERSFSVETTTGQAGGGEIDWRPVISAIVSQSARTKDIWLPVYLARAGARAGQFETIEAGLAYLDGLLQRYWDTMHPKLEELEFPGRNAPCEALGTIAEFVAPLKNTPLLEHPRLGKFSGADFARFRANAEAEPDYGNFRAVLEDVGDEPLVSAAEVLQRIESHLKSVDSFLSARADAGGSASFQATFDALRTMRADVLSYSSQPAAEDAPADSTAEPGGEAAPAGAYRGGVVNSREDVVKAIDAICEYYRRKEPASPVPLGLQRVREWVTLDFIALLEDIAPNSLGDVKLVLMSQRVKDESGGG